MVEFLCCPSRKCIFLKIVSVCQRVRNISKTTLQVPNMTSAVTFGTEIESPQIGHFRITFQSISSLPPADKTLGIGRNIFNLCLKVHPSSHRPLYVVRLRRQTTLSRRNGDQVQVSSSGRYRLSCYRVGRSLRLLACALSYK